MSKKKNLSNYIFFLFVIGSAWICSFSFFLRYQIHHFFFLLGSAPHRSWVSDHVQDGLHVGCFSVRQCNKHFCNSANCLGSNWSSLAKCVTKYLNTVALHFVLSFSVLKCRLNLWSFYVSSHVKWAFVVPIYKSLVYLGTTCPFSRNMV